MDGTTRAGPDLGPARPSCIRPCRRQPNSLSAGVKRPTHGRPRIPIVAARTTPQRAATDPTVRDEVRPVGTAARHAEPGWYPGAYRIAYDAKAREYRVALVQLAKRD